VGEYLLSRRELFAAVGPPGQSEGFVLAAARPSMSENKIGSNTQLQ
jgi:hypothetical protein